MFCGASGVVSCVLAFCQVVPGPDSPSCDAPNSLLLNDLCFGVNNGCGSSFFLKRKKKKVQVFQ